MREAPAQEQEGWKGSKYKKEEGWKGAPVVNWRRMAEHSNVGVWKEGRIPSTGVKGEGKTIEPHSHCVLDISKILSSFPKFMQKV